jgi:hypothetical protein
MELTRANKSKFFAVLLAAAMVFGLMPSFGTVWAAGAPLDKDNLADGAYTLHADMIKMNRKDNSMANDAIDHNLALTVEGGKYYIMVDFKGLKIKYTDGKEYYGYLSKLRYYDPVAYDDIGNPTGAPKDASVLSYHTNADGSYIVDAYNNASSPYPKQLKFPLVNRAGYENNDVPLQVFVPIMEALATGSGTQDVLMRLDWSKLRLQGEVDKSELSAKITEAEAIRQGSKGTKAYDALQAAVAAARSVAGKGDVTQTEADAALAQLKAAVATFESSADVTNLLAAKVTIADKVWTGKKITSGFDVSVDGKKLAVGTDYTITATGANKDIGKGTVTITGAGGYENSIMAMFNIVPKMVNVKSAKAGRKSLTVNWKSAPKAEKITKYEVRYKIRGVKSWKTKAVSVSKVSLVVKKLKKGKRYEVQARAYRTVGGVKYYSAWSAVRTSGTVK